MTKDYVPGALRVYVLPEHGENALSRGSADAETTASSGTREYKAEGRTGSSAAETGFALQLGYIACILEGQKQRETEARQKRVCSARTAAKMPNWRSKPERNVRPIIKGNTIGRRCQTRWNSMKKRVASD